MVALGTLPAEDAARMAVFVFLALPLPVPTAVFTRQRRVTGWAAAGGGISHP